MKKRRLADPLKPTQEQLRFLVDLANYEDPQQTLAARFRKIFPGYHPSKNALCDCRDGEDPSNTAFVEVNNDAPLCLVASAIRDWITSLTNGFPMTLPTTGISSVRVCSTIDRNGSLVVKHREAVSGERDFLSSFVAPLFLNADPFPFIRCELCLDISLRNYGNLKVCGRTACLKAAGGASMDWATDKDGSRKRARATEQAKAGKEAA